MSYRKMKIYGNKKRKDGKSGSASKNTGKKKKIRLWMIICIVILAIVVSGFTFYKMTVKPPELPPEQPVITKRPGVVPNNDPNTSQPPEDEHPEQISGRKKEFYTFILAGTDLDDYHTDTLMVASYDAVNKKLNVVSIPRDSMINVPWSIKKINSAYGVGGIDRLKDELEKVIGFAPDYYAVVNLQGFVDLIDAIGGLKYDVPQKMYLKAVDPALDIDLKPGLQELNGKKALMLVRFRSYGEGDIKRIQVQQDFMKSLAKQILTIQNIPKISEFARILEKYMKSDLTLGNMVWFGQEIMKLDSETDIEFHTLPGNTGASYNGQSYVTLYKDQVLEMVNEYLNPYTEDIKASDLDIIGVSDLPKITPPSPSPSPTPAQTENPEDEPQEPQGPEDLPETPDVSREPTQRPENTTQPPENTTQPPVNTQPPENTTQPPVNTDGVTPVPEPTVEATRTPS